MTLTLVKLHDYITAHEHVCNCDYSVAYEKILNVRIELFKYIYLLKGKQT